MKLKWREKYIHEPIAKVELRIASGFEVEYKEYELSDNEEIRIYTQYPDGDIPDPKERKRSFSEVDLIIEKRDHNYRIKTDKYPEGMYDDIFPPGKENAITISAIRGRYTCIGIKAGHSRMRKPRITENIIRITPCYSYGRHYGKDRFWLTCGSLSSVWLDLDFHHEIEIFIDSGKTPWSTLEGYPIARILKPKEK